MQVWSLSAILALLIMGYNAMCIDTFRASPNTAYPLVIVNANVLLVALASYVFLGETFHATSVIGMVVAFLGICMVILGQR